MTIPSNDAIKAGARAIAEWRGYSGASDELARAAYGAMAPMIHAELVVGLQRDSAALASAMRTIAALQAEVEEIPKIQAQALRDAAAVIEEDQYERYDPYYAGWLRSRADGIEEDAGAESEGASHE